MSILPMNRLCNLFLPLLLNFYITDDFALSTRSLSTLKSSRQSRQRIRQYNHRSFEEEQINVTTSVPHFLNLSLDGDSQCHGHLFHLESIGEGFNITAISVHLDTTEPVSLSISRKEGSYLGYSGRSKPWVEIYSGVVVGNGRGRKSHIPNLLPIMVEEQSVLSLFIQTKSNHMLCSELPDQYLGAPLYKNKDLKICVGANTKVYPFNGSPMDISNGRWNGYLEYQLESDLKRDNEKNALFLPIQKTYKPTNFRTDYPTNTPTEAEKSNEFLISSKLPTRSPTEEPSYKTTYIQRTFKPTYRPKGTSNPTTEDLTSIINKEMSVPPSYSTQSTTSDSPSRCVTSVPKSLFSTKELLDETKPSFSYKTHGIMFDVIAIASDQHFPLEITTFGFYADAYVGDNVSYMVYTKLGSHVGYERMASAWNLHTSGTVPSAGPLTETKMLHFPHIQINKKSSSNQIVSFYITLNQEILFYDRKSYSIQGENSDFQIMVGTPVLTYPPFSFKSGQDDDLSNSLVPPKRAFVGSLFYESFIPCTNVSNTPSSTLSPSSTPSQYPTTFIGMVETSIPYIFNIDYDGSDFEFVILTSIDETVKHTLFEQLHKYEEMKTHIESGDIIWIDITSRDRDDAMPSCALNTPRCSSVIETTVVVQHKSSIPRELIRYYFLNEASNIASSFPFTDEGRYLGPKASQTDTAMSLNNVDLDQLDLTDIHYLEDVIKNFLNKQLLKFETPVQISMVKIHDSQSLNLKQIEYSSPLNSHNTKHSNRNSYGSKRFLVSDETDYSSDFYVTITGEYQPPPEVNFDVVVEDSFTDQPEQFLEALKENKKFVNVDHFETQRVILSGRVNKDEDNEKENLHVYKLFLREGSKFTTSQESFILYGTVVIIVALFILYFMFKCYRKMKERQTYHREFERYLSSKRMTNQLAKNDWRQRKNSMTGSARVVPLKIAA